MNITLWCSLKLLLLHRSIFNHIYTVIILYTYYESRVILYISLMFNINIALGLGRPLLQQSDWNPAISIVDRKLSFDHDEKRYHTVKCYYTNRKYNSSILRMDLIITFSLYESYSPICGDVWYTALSSLGIVLLIFFNSQKITVQMEKNGIDLFTWILFLLLFLRTLRSEFPFLR